MEIIQLSTGVELRPIPISPNEDYAAGSDGKIYSRTKCAGFGRKTKVYVEWYSLAGHRTKKGYLSISMCHNSKKKTHSVHRLVCMAFHGMPDPPTLQVRHLDGNPENCAPENLRWGTQEENWQDRRAHGHGCEGEKHWAAKLSDVEREHVRWAVKYGLCSQHHVAKVLRMSQAAISAICLSR